VMLGDGLIEDHAFETLRSGHRAFHPSLPR
jgi:hypothetical protein